MGLLWFYQNEHKDLEKEKLKAELEKSGAMDELNAIYEDSFENDDYIKEEYLFLDAISWENVKDKFYMFN